MRDEEQTVQPAGEDAGSGEDDAAAALLAPGVDASRYPVLAGLLAGAEGLALRAELLDLLSPQLRLRAPRRYVRVMCRLQGPGYDEPVLLTDISASGVRFLIQSDVPLDITRFGRMSLRVRTSLGPRELEVALVRRCGGDARHTDIACRFLSAADDLATTVAELRSVIFGEA